MITIDGSFGEGGGQVLRTSLSLATRTGNAFAIERIRAGRAKPGLLRQHLCCVKAMQEICGAQVEGAELRSERLVFEPGEVRPGEYSFSVGSAGSACLVLQTVLPVLLMADAPSKLTLEGGTHNPMAPTFEFLDRVFFPVLARMGAKVSASLKRAGFYPAGGGQMTVEIEPVARLQPIDLIERGALTAKRAVASVANIPLSIAEREVEGLRKALEWEEECFEARALAGVPGPGNVVQVEIEHGAEREILVGFGEKSLPVHRLVRALAKQVRSYLESTAPVGVYLADQLLLPMAIAGGGSFRTVGLSEHARTNIEIIGKFLSIEIKVDRKTRGDVWVEVSA